MADIQAEDAYGRARRDAAFLQRVRDADTGRWDVLDALWWHSHPFEPAPSGIPAPAAELRELKRRLFSQDGDASGDPVTTALTSELEATISAERAAIQHAIERAQSTSENHAHSTDEDVASVSVPGRMPDIAYSAAVAPPVTRTALSPKRNLAVVVGIVAAVIGGMAVGAQLTSGTDAAPPGASPTPMNTASPVVMLEAAPLALAVFDRPQEPMDVPSVPMPEALELESSAPLAPHPFDPTMAKRDGLTSTRIASSQLGQRRTWSVWSPWFHQSTICPPALSRLIFQPRVFGCIGREA